MTPRRASIVRFKFQFAAFDRWKVERARKRAEEAFSAFANFHASAKFDFTDFAKEVGEHFADICSLPRHHGHPLSPSRHKPKRKKRT